MAYILMHPTHSCNLLPRAKSVFPDTDQQMGVVLVVPVDCPIHGRLETVDRDRVHFKVLHSLEVLDDRLKLVVPRNDSLSIDGRYRLERKEDSLLPQ